MSKKQMKKIRLWTRKQFCNYHWIGYGNMLTQQSTVHNNNNIEHVIRWIEFKNVGTYFTCHTN